jgi:hypothetical protein
VWLLMLDLLQIPTAELFAFLAAIAFAAGLNVYATVAVLGLLGRFGHLPLPPGLHLLENWIVIAAAAFCSWSSSSPTKFPPSI